MSARSQAKTERQIEAVRRAGRGLDKPLHRNYLSAMNFVRRTVEMDSDTDARLRELAAERGQDVSAVLAEAVALLDSVVDISNPDIEEDRRRLRAFGHSGEAIPLHQVKAWVESWGTDNELPRPEPQRIG
jgi:predicted transcriptional regulator